LEKEEYQYSQSKAGYITVKNIPIRVFYTICKALGQNCVLTIGKDLIARGISYVSEDTSGPLTATTMIYIPGTSMHSVGICQTVGRITGCAMPNLKRTLYAPQDVIDTYISYNKNQESYLQKIKITNDLTKNIIKSMTFEKLSRNIDRPKLGLKMNTTRIQYTGDVDVEKMKQLIKIWKKANTIIGKIFRFIASNEIGVSELELKEYIKDIGASVSWFSDLGKSEKYKDYSYVFERTSNGVTAKCPSKVQLKISL
jgi:hypothetical protein